MQDLIACKVGPVLRDWMDIAHRTIWISGMFFERVRFYPTPEAGQWGCSSVGRAVALQAIGQEFESPQLHQLISPALACDGRVAQLVRACA